MGSKPLLALLSGIGAGTLLFGPLAITSSVPLQETRIAAPEVRTWIPVNGLWTRCDPARVNHSDQAVRWKPAFHVVDIKEHGIDEMTPIWNLLDLTPQGRGKFYASLDYGLKVKGAQAARG